MEEKLITASYNNPTELLNPISEILNAGRNKKNGSLVHRILFLFMLFFLFFLLATLIIQYLLGEPSVVRLS